MSSTTSYKDGYREHVYVHGIRDTATFRTKREARAWGVRREAEILAELGHTKSLHTLRQMLEKYRDEVSPSKRGKRWETVRLNHFLTSEKLPLDKPVTQCTSEELGVWRDYRLLTVSAGTVLRDFSLLSAVFEQARLEWKWVTTNLINDVRKPRSPDHRTTVITRPQIKLILGALGYKRNARPYSMNESVAHCFLLALRSGMRAGELCNLTWDNVKTNHCFLPVTKTKPRFVPLSDKAVRIINKMYGFHPNLVFGLKAQTLDTLFRKAKAKAGVEGVTFHDARHTAATWIVATKRVDVLTLCKIFGWSNATMGLTYYNPKAEDISKQLNAPISLPKPAQSESIHNHST